MHEVGQPVHRAKSNILLGSVKTLGAAASFHIGSANPDERG
jgi:hypothetical protein